MKILCIEDESIILKTVEFKLKKDGYDVVIARDGKEGMEKIESEKPDLILTDIMMPYASGLEVISYVRTKLELKTPIIVLSALGQEETVIKAFELGADDYITKPFSPNELSIRVKKASIRI